MMGPDTRPMRLEDLCAGAMVASRGCNTGPSNNESHHRSSNAVIGWPQIGETEIETEVLRRARARHRGRFLKGPIPLRQIAAANRLPGQALALFLAVHHQTALTKKTIVTLPRGLLTDFGISPGAKARGLQWLEGAGLIRVERSRGRAARVELITVPR